MSTVSLQRLVKDIDMRLEHVYHVEYDAATVQKRLRVLNNYVDRS